MSELVFLPYESAACGALRLLEAELRTATQAAELGATTDRLSVFEECVHETRKRIKRLRALLRLLSPHLGKREKQLHAALREIAQSLGASREATAAIEAIDRLEEQTLHPDEAAFDRARRSLNPSHHNGAAPDHPLLQSALGELGRVGDILRSIELDEPGFDLLETGLHSSHKRAQKTLSLAERELSPHAFHELRKAVKAQQHQLAYLIPLWPAVLGARHLELTELSEVLGEHHDLALLLPPLRSLGLDELIPLAERRLLLLEQHILSSSRRAFAEKAGFFSGSLRAWFENYQTLNTSKEHH